MIYLAGPIDDVSLERATHWRVCLIQKLSPRGFWFFDPAAAFGSEAFEEKPTSPPGPAEMAAIATINFAALRATRGVILYIERSLTARMTYVELGVALERGLPIVVISPEPPGCVLGFKFIFGDQLVLVENSDLAVDYVLENWQWMKEQ